MATTVDTNSEQHRHDCECRDFVLRFWPDVFAANEHLKQVQARRGALARRRLQKDALSIWENKTMEDSHVAAQ